MDAETDLQSTGYPTIITDFGYSPEPAAIWRDLPQDGLEYRDLSLDAASAGALQGRHVRTKGVAVESRDWIASEAVFSFIFVIRGTVTLTETGSAPVALEAKAAATRFGAGDAANWAFSPDAEVMAFISKPAGAAQFGAAPTGGARWGLSHEHPDSYKLGEGPRKFFKYRDLGTEGPTNRRVKIQIVAATGPSPAGGTGRHTHTMGQIFYVLNGWADLAVQNRPWVRMSPGDAMCLCAGLGHDVTAFASDYVVLEMCVPADYETIDAADKA